MRTSHRLDQFLLSFLAIALLWVPDPGFAEEQTAPMVDFATQILPILQKNCLACHNRTEAESDLVLESAQTMLKGGTGGPVIIERNGEASRLYRLASHAEEPFMPPQDNSVGANRLTPDELLLLKTWIDQGAGGTSPSTTKINWQTLPPGVNPVLAVATSADGRFVAAGRANQVFLYHAASGMDMGRLSDPSLQSSALYGHAGFADMDLIQSLAFSPNGEWIASGGYRTAKLWRRDAAEMSNWPGLAPECSAMGVAGPDGSIIIGLRNGSLRELNRQTGQLGDPWDAHTSPVTRIVPWQSNSLITLSADGHLILWNHDRRERLAELAPPAPALDICSISDADIVIAHADHSLRIWTLRPSEAGSNLPFVWSETNKIAELSQAIVDLDYSVSTRRLGVGATDGSMAVYDLSQNAVMRQWNQGSPVRRISITADGNRVAAVGDDGKPRIWDIASSNLVAELSTNYEVKDVFDRAVFGRDLANRHVENAKQDLEQEKQRLQQETDNHKKTQENLMKAEEEAKKKTDAVNAAAAEVMKDEVSLASLKGQLSASETVLAENRRKRSEAEAAYDALFVRIAEHQTLYAQTKEELQQASQALMDAQTRAEQAKDNTELAQQVTACQEKVRLATEKRTAQDAARRASLKTLIDQSQVLEQANSAEQESQAMVAKATEAIAPVEKTLAEKRSAADKSTNELADAKRALESATASVEQARVAIEQSELRVKESQDNVTQCEVKQQHAEQYRAEAEKRQAESPLRIVDSVFSTDGLWLTLIAENGAISTWTASQGQLVITNGLINDGHAAMVPVDHHGLYIMSAEGSIRMVKIVPTWSLIHTIGSADGESPFSDRVTAVCFSPDSTELAVGGGSPSRSGELKIFSVVDATEKRDLANIHSDVVYGLAYSPDGRFLASCGADRFMKVTDIASGEIHRTFEGHTHHVLSVDWQADGRVLATTGADKVVKLWNFREGSQIRTIQGFGKEVTSVRYYGPNDVFFVVSGDKSIYQCNLNGNRNSVGVGDDFLYSVSASQIGDTIAYGGHDSVVRIIDGSGKHRVQMKPAN